jgi:rubrerythrin
MTPLSRRALLGRSLAGASALALPGSLIAAATAQAQDAEGTDETDALGRLIILEQAAELAFSLAAEEGDVSADAKTLFEELSIHAEDHATAFSEAMDQLVVDPPEADSDPEDYDSLNGFDPAADEKDLLAFLIDLELGLIEAYEEDQAELDEPDLVRSAAQIAASHAQALVALRLLAGGKGLLTKLPAPSTSATASEDDDSGS